VVSKFQNLTYTESLMLCFISVFGKIDGRKRIQKLVYLLKYKFNQPVPFEFEKHFYGPYSRKVQDMIDNLVALGLLDETHQMIYTYSVSEKGKLIASLTRSNIPQQIMEQILRLKDEYEHTSTSRIVSEVYNIAGIQS
jgi:uncharacterized protein YwgA